MADVSFDFSGFEELEERLNRISGEAFLKVKEDAVKELASVYLRNAKENTPVLGIQTKKLANGTVISTDSEHMRRSWHAGDLESTKKETKIKVYNGASYAAFVNDGHRQIKGRFVPILGKCLVKGWVEGLYITDKAENAVKRKASAILIRNLERILRGYSE